MARLEDLEILSMTFRHTFNQKCDGAFFLLLKKRGCRPKLTQFTTLIELYIQLRKYTYHNIKCNLGGSLFLFDHLFQLQTPNGHPSKFKSLYDRRTQGKTKPITKLRILLDQHFQVASTPVM